MIDRAVLESIIRAGTQAPSGDNSQPWSFRIDQNTIVVHAHPERDHPILNVEGRGTLIATGALLENMTVAALHEGYDADVTLTLSSEETARVRLRPVSTRGHHHFTAIQKRHTHRGPYHIKISDKIMSALAVQVEPGVEVVFITDRESLQEVAEAVSVMEETALSVKKLHQAFFRSLVWSEEANRAGMPGLYIKTTELPPPVQGFFRIVQYWPVMKLLQMVGFPKVAARSNAAIYTQSGLIAGILIRDTNAENFIAAGRVMQRLWLAAVHHGLSAQPLAGLLYLTQYIEATDDAHISPTLKDHIRSAYAAIQTIFARNGNGMVAMLLRIGIATKNASARSQRLPPHVI